MRLIAILILGWMAIGTTASANDSKKTVLDIWIRKPVQNARDNPKGNLISMDIKGLTLDELETFDIQYEKKVKVRGFHLRDIFSIYKPIPENVDVMNLYTKNGMIIPVSIGKLRQNVQVFIATTIFSNGKWTSEFPTSVRIKEKDKSEITVQFTGAKVVVGEEWRVTDNGFTPWRNMDTLTGIELIESGAYSTQFQNINTSKKALYGRLVFLGRCQFCHGVLGIGATRGPNLETVVNYKAKSAVKDLLQQVTAPGRSQKSPHFMPAQNDFSKRDAKDLISWLATLEGGKPDQYEPSYAKTVQWK